MNKYKEVNPYEFTSDKSVEEMNKDQNKLIRKYKKTNNDKYKKDIILSMRPLIIKKANQYVSQHK